MDGEEMNGISRMETPSPPPRSPRPSSPTDKSGIREIILLAINSASHSVRASLIIILVAIS